MVELAKITGDMLLISFVAFAVGGLMQPGHEVAMAAMGIAIYISGQHCKVLRTEMRALRAQIRRQSVRNRRTVDTSKRAGHLSESFRLR